MTDERPAATDLAIVDAQISLKTLEFIANTELVPRDVRGKPQAMMAKILYGRELGLAEMTSLQEINMIDGKPSPSASVLTALIRQAGHRVRPAKLTDKEAVAVAERLDDDGNVVEAFEFTFTWAMAERAKLTNKNNWKGYPEAMLWWRAVAQAARIMFPEVLLSLKYLPDELESGDWVEPPTDTDGHLILPEDANTALEHEMNAHDVEDADTVDICPECGGSEAGEENPHSDNCSQRPMTAEEVAEELEGEVVAETTASDLFGGAEPAVEQPTDDPVEQAWRDIPIMLGADPTAGTREQILEYLESLCGALEVVELFPEDSLARGITRWERDMTGKDDADGRWGAGKLRRKDDCQAFAKRIHTFAVTVYDKHLQGGTDGE